MKRLLLIVSVIVGCSFIFVKDAPAPLSSPGTVTSVAMSVPTQEFSVSGTPVTTSGTLAVTNVAVYAVGNITGATTVNWNNGACQSATLTGNVTLTFSNPVNGTWYCLSLTQDGTGSRTVTFPGSLVWSNNTAQSVNATAGVSTHFLFKYNGTSFLGFSLTGIAPVWSSLTAPTANLSLNMGTYQTAFTTDTNFPASAQVFTFSTPAGTDASPAGYVVDVHTNDTNFLPLRVTANGITAGVAMDTAGELAAIGGGSIRGTPKYCADAGANDTYTCTLSPAITAYVTGVHYAFKANTANTGAATINFNALGAKTIKKAVGGVTTDLSDNDIRAGQIVLGVYDGTNMQMQSTSGGSLITYDKAGTVIAAAHAVQDTVTMIAGTGTVTLTGASVFTSSTSYTCVGADDTSITAVKVTQTSGSSITFDSAGSDVVRYICLGN